ncbi:MAG: hypothetical protein ACYCVN_13125 [Acidimicrobiales bacterium]
MTACRVARVATGALVVLAGLVATAASIGLIAAPAGAAGAAVPPQVHTSTQYATVGQLVQVTGTGWSPVGQTVEIQICGQNALDLSNDCSQSNQYTAAIRAGGVFYGSLDVQIPPVPCPCVFLVTAPGVVNGVTVPLTILGAPIVAPPPQPKATNPVAVVAQLNQPLSVSGWFGGPKVVTLVLSVSNTSTIAFTTATLSVTVGHGANPTGYVVGQQLAPLAVGATQVLRIPVTIPIFAYGHYTVRAQVTTGQGTVTAATTITTYPWGWPVAVLVVLILMLLLVRHRHRRAEKRARAVQPGPAVDAPVPPGDPAEATPASSRQTPHSPAPPSPMPPVAVPEAPPSDP